MSSFTIKDAKLAAVGYRFSEDRPQPLNTGNPSTGRLNSLLLQNSLEISSALTPTLAVSLNNVCERLQFPRQALKAFTHSSSEVQAQCFVTNDLECFVGISSALIELLDVVEFEFVVGHELGHFLFDHVNIETKSQLQDPRYFFLRRAQEISVDRVGMRACGSLEAAIRALMKSASGLSERHLRFDVSSYLDQLRKIDAGVQDDQSDLTHPSILIRSRALLWYSLEEATRKSEESKVDARITRDLRKYVDGRFRKRIEDTKGELMLWTLAERILEHGTLTQVAQQSIMSAFGIEISSKIRELFRTANSDFVRELVFSKKRDLREELEILIPDEFVEEVSKIRTRTDEFKIS